MPLPPTKFDPRVRTMSELRQAHPHLYEHGDWKGPLVWERLWSTASGAYGSFQHAPTRRLPPNGKLNGLWEAREWGTSYAEYGKDVIPTGGRNAVSPEEGTNDATRQAQLAPLGSETTHERHQPELRMIAGHKLLPPIGQQ